MKIIYSGKVKRVTPICYFKHFGHHFFVFVDIQRKGIRLRPPFVACHTGMGAMVARGWTPSQAMSKARIELNEFGKPGFYGAIKSRDIINLG